MTTPLRLRDLPAGRGRVFLDRNLGWNADYRTPDGTLYGVWAFTPAEAADWIRNKAKEAQK